MYGPVGAATGRPGPHSPRWNTYPAGVLHRPVPRLLTLAVAATGGWVTDAAFPQRSWWPLAIVGVAALVWSIQRDSARWNFLVTWLWGLGFFLPHLWWANYAVGVIPWAALSVAEAAIMAGGVAAWTWIRRGVWIRDKRWLHAPLFALSWVVAEQLRQVWPFGGFPWGRLAFSQVDSPLLSLASVAGAPLVSFAVALAGFFLASAVQWLTMGRRAAARGEGQQRAGGPGSVAPRDGEGGRWRGVLTSGVATALVLAIGALLPLPSTAAQSGTLRLGAVQGNVSQPGLGAFANAREVLNNHARGTHELAEQVGQGNLDLVVWPENGTDVNPRADSAAAEVVDNAAQAAGAPILLGTDRYGTDTEGNRARFNEMVLWEPGDGAQFAYAKQIPAAFAEYIPMRSVARLFSPAVDLVPVDMAPGTKKAVVPVEVPRLGHAVQVGTIICFEVAYDALIRESVQAGAQMLIVPTNNASFGYTAESMQQLAMSRLRAVEHGRTTVQISTVGVSGVIAADGTVRHETDLFTHEYFAADIPLRTTITIADRLGDWPMIIATGLAVLALLLGVATGRRSRRPGPADPPGEKHVPPQTPGSPPAATPSDAGSQVGAGS